MNFRRTNDSAIGYSILLVFLEVIEEYAKAPVFYDHRITDKSCNGYGVFSKTCLYKTTQLKVTEILTMKLVAIQSRLCKGQYSFAKTYFGWGLLGTVALSVSIFWLLGPIFFQQDHGRGDRAISVTFRIWSFVTTFYMIGVCIGLNYIRKRDDRRLLNLYIIMLIVCTALLFLSSLAAAPVYWFSYGVTAFIAYKIRTNQNLRESSKS